ncbi:MAG: hypothetical protein R3C49_24160 [Planctomycetaceae bacterium]
MATFVGCWMSEAITRLHHLLYDSSDDPDLVTKELIEVVLDINTPAKTCQTLQELLIEEAPETEVLVNGLLQIRLAYDEHRWNRGWGFEIGQRLWDVQEHISLVVNHLREHFRGGIIGLEDFACISQRHPEFRDTLSEILLQKLPQMDHAERTMGILTLGRMQSPVAISELEKLRDTDPEFRIQAAFYIWGIDHDAEKFFSVAEQIFQARALRPKLEACRLVAVAGQEHEVSEHLKSFIRELAKTQQPTKEEQKKMSPYGQLQFQVSEEARKALNWNHDKH